MAQWKSQTRKSLPKSHQDYWASRLVKRVYDRNGDPIEIPDWQVRIAFLGRREWFNLRTANKAAASVLARDIFAALLTIGWDGTLAKYKPESVLNNPAPTVGEYLTEVGAKSGLRPRTLRNYANCLRTIVAGIQKIESGKAKYDYRSGGNTEWRQKIDGVKLSAITPEKVQAWKVGYLRDAGSSPGAQVLARRTINSYLRCARSLFSRKTTRFLSLEVPNPTPLAGVELEKTGSMRYQSKIDAKELIGFAKTELKEDHPDVYKIFVLGLFCGLRRAEIDGLEWSAIDWTKRVIRITNTDTLRVKTDGSEGVVDLDQKIAQELRSLNVGTESTFVVASHRTARPDSETPYYRCQHHFEFLTDWLRRHGVTANKPLHELRKELGALIVSRHGIFAAAHVLRHSDISTTARHYAAQKHRVDAGLGEFL